jgi:hypothetical protein
MMFDLHTLGWHSFQQLCLTVSREVFGQTVESFLDSADAGQDGAFTGTWMPQPSETLSGRFVIQAKFTSKRDARLQPSNLGDEIQKAARLAKRGRCSIYILLTNFGVTGQATEKIVNAFEQAGIPQVRIYGYTWICDQIREKKRLRMMVPRLYGLGDLTQILDDRIYQQARALLDSMREDLAKVVLTDAYRKSADALRQHGFVLLTGEPAAGKTTIAAMLSVAALDQWQASTIKVQDAKGITDHWNPDEPTQFFWIDDAFGAMQYEPLLAAQWNHIAPQVNAMIRKGARVVMTSRDYIYKRARFSLKQSAFPLLEESQVVIDVHELTSDEKRQMLYNHLKLGSQPLKFRRLIKPYLEGIAINPRFIPEMARRIGNPLFTKDVELSEADLKEFVDKQEEFLDEVLRGLDDHSKAALAIIFMRNGFLDSPFDLAPTERSAVERIGSDLGSCIKALESMEGSLVRYTKSSPQAVWTFKHPTIGDAFASLLLKSPELLGIYVKGAPIEDLMTQVTCGHLQIQGAVVLPATLFAVVANRLRQFSDSSKKYSATSAVYSFLTHRCSKDFLLSFIDLFPEFLESTGNPGLMLDSSPSANLAIRLANQGLLPEANRIAFVETVTSYAKEGIDLSSLYRPALRAVFTPTEEAELKKQIRYELLPNLNEVRKGLQADHDSDVDPADHMHYFQQGLEAIAKEFAGNADIVSETKRQTHLVEEWIAEVRSELQDEEDPRSLSELVEREASQAYHSGISRRTIFDDIDQ